MSGFGTFPGFAAAQMATIFEAASTAASQTPTALGDAGIIRVEFGPAQGTASDEIQVDATGIFTFNRGGAYLLDQYLQFGRVGGAGTSFLFARSMVSLGGGPFVQSGITVEAKVDNVNIIVPTRQTLPVQLPAGARLYFEIARDAAGNNSGGLYRDITTLTGWTATPTARSRIFALR